MDARRRDILDRARLQRAEIEQYFIDGAYWNDCVRTPDEEPIDLDPTGNLRRMADALDEMLALDQAKGGVGSIDAPSLSILFQKEPRGIQ
jgi:hypothetical protein